MGKDKNATEGVADAQMSAYPTPSCHRGEAGDTDNAVQDVRDDVVHWREACHGWVPLPRCPSHLCNPANHLPNDL